MYRKITLSVFGGLALLALAACSKENQAVGDSLKTAANESPKTVAAIELTTYKSASCGCCKQWVAHATKSGFSVSAHDVADLNAVKKQHAIEPRFQSCHTSVSSDGYVFEGHIPAKLIRRFLQSPPAGARGLAVPAMPLGSPGMEYGDGFTPYQVWQLNSDGSQQLYATVSAAGEQF